MNEPKNKKTKTHRHSAKPSRPTFSDKPGLEARVVATKLLSAVVDRKVSLDGMLDPVHGNPAYKSLGDADRALVRAIVATSLRHLLRLEAAIGSLLETPLPAGALSLHHLLIVAAAQILHLDVPSHAAVDLAVEQANRDPRNRRFAKLVNAVLRRLIREKDAVLAQVAVVPPIPDWFRDRLISAYGEDEAARIMEAQLSPAPIDLTVKSDAPAWGTKLGGRLLPTGSIRLPLFDGAVSDLPGYAEGAWWVQDAAASIPARLFGDLKGRRVADLCAAPGGKTAQLVASGAQVVAVEQSPNRLARLKENLNRLNMTAELIAGDLFDLRPEERFDGVLLDAPCSSTGTTRRHPDVFWTKGTADVEKLAGLQERMLRHALTLVKPGGIVVFSNCSLDPLEGEELVEKVLADTPVAKRVPVKAVDWPGLDSAITAKGDFRTTPAMLPPAEGYAGGMDGFFASVLQVT